MSEVAPSTATREDKLALAHKQANAALALASMGRWETVWSKLPHSPDPTVRSYLIDRLGPSGVSSQTVRDRLLGPEADVSIRRALLLSLAEFDDDSLLPVERAELVPRLLELYRDDPDPGIHGAVDWLLRQWGQEEKVGQIDCELATGEVVGHRRWYVNGEGQTLVLVPPGEVVLQGQTIETLPSREVVWKEGDARVSVRIEQRFALAAREVTVAEFLRFRPDHRYQKEYARTGDSPVNYVTWFLAAAYCNYLSEREGIPRDQWCYVPNEKGEYAEGMKLADDWQKRKGYRLPIEAEWEHACRAGSVTAWSLGDAEELLGKYAWTLINSSFQLHPVGRLRPNDLGLFDMHGNAWEWCQDKYVPLAQQDRDGTSPKVIDQRRSFHVLRGGCFSSTGLSVRSDLRYSNAVESLYHTWGFRPARTYP